VTCAANCSSEIVIAFGYSQDCVRNDTILGRWGNKSHCLLGRINVMIGDFNETGVTNYSFLPNSLRNLKNKNNQIKYYYYYTQSKIFKHEGDK